MKPPLIMRGSVVRVLHHGQPRRVFVQHPRNVKAGVRWAFEVVRLVGRYKPAGRAIGYRSRAARASRFTIAEDYSHSRP